MVGHKVPTLRAAMGFKGVGTIVVRPNNIGPEGPI